MIRREITFSLLLLILLVTIVWAGNTRDTFVTQTKPPPPPAVSNPATVAKVVAPVPAKPLAPTPKPPAPTPATKVVAPAPAKLLAPPPTLKAGASCPQGTLDWYGDCAMFNYMPTRSAPKCDPGTELVSGGCFEKCKSGFVRETFGGGCRVPNMSKPHIVLKAK